MEGGAAGAEGGAAAGGRGGGAGGAPACAAALLGHAGWVNGVGLLDGGRLVATGSSDGAVRLWRRPEAEAGGPPAAPPALAVLGGHSDAVTCLAVARGAGGGGGAAAAAVVSAGLRGEWFLWDAAREAGGAGGGEGAGGAPVASGRGPASVYSVAADPEGALVCTGDSGGAVRLWDPRAGTGAVATLKGHGDTVRALALAGGRRTLVSGASDRALKLWDLGQQRCVRTFAVHSDSVWALGLDAEGRAYSGGRDGCVFRTHLESRSSELLARTDKPVQALALCPAGEGVWVASLGGSSVARWDLPPGGAAAAASGDRWGRGSKGSPPASPKTPTGPSAFSPSTSPLTTGRRLSRGPRRSGSSRLQDPDALTPLLGAEPGLLIAGGPSVVRLEVLNDRRRILCLASDGGLHLLDVCRMAWAEAFGPCEGQGGFEGKLEALQTRTSVPAWFSAECRLGVPVVRLEPPQCFSCEAYVSEFVKTSNDEAKLNMGQQLLRAALAKCVERGGLGAGTRGWKAPLDSPVFRFGGDVEGREGGGGGVGGSLGGHRAGPGDGLALISVSAAGEPWRKNLEDFTGDEVGRGWLPKWAVEALSPPHASPGAQGKLGFLLQPAEGSDLPALLQGRLTAPRILPIKKVKVFVLNKLASTLKAGGAEGEGSPELKAGDFELLCGGELLGELETLASVRAFFWKKPGDITLDYRRKVK